MQKRDEERASPENGRGGGVPEQPDEGPWDLSPNAGGGGGHPKKPALRDTVMRDLGRNKGWRPAWPVPAVKSLTSDTRLSPPPAGPKSRSRRLS